MKVLLVKLSSMGDVIHAFPAVSEALAARPDLSVDWCVDAGLVELVRLHPGVRAVHGNDAIGVPGAGLGATKLRRSRQALRGCGFDLVIDAQGLIKSAIVARLAGAPVAGYDRRSIREPLASLAYRHRYGVARDLHATTRMRLLFAAALGYEANRVAPFAGLRLSGEADPGSVLLLHGTTAEAKRWPTAHWQLLAAQLRARGLRPAVTWSTAGERRVADAIVAAVPSTRLIPRQSLGGIAAEIGRAGLVIGVDTGLAHLADAAGIPTLMLFQASNPELTGPLGRRSEALVAGEMLPVRPQRRMSHLAAPAARVVPVEQVLAAVDRVVGQYA